MPTPQSTREEILERLMETFRVHGYDGASLALLAERTRLGKSSLYHYFPGGKEQMATEVLAHLDAMMQQSLIQVAAEPGPARQLARLLALLDTFYDGGRKACLLERLCASVDRARFAKPLAGAFAALLDVFSGIGRAAGLSAARARAQAETAVVRIEGALVVAAGTADPRVFTRTLADLAATMLVGSGAPRSSAAKRR